MMFLSTSCPHIDTHLLTPTQTANRALCKDVQLYIKKTLLYLVVETLHETKAYHHGEFCTLSTVSYYIGCKSNSCKKKKIGVK